MTELRALPSLLVREAGLQEVFVDSYPITRGQQSCQARRKEKALPYIEWAWLL